jgi:phosphatidylserine/phosphatidylglycerophosphate/cardiolipin synthase-like enzyme
MPSTTTQASAASPVLTALRADTFQRPARVRPGVPAFFDRAEDVRTTTAADDLLALRAKTAAGGKVELTDLHGFTHTTGKNQVKLHLDRAYYEEGALPLIDAAESSIHIASLMFDDGPVGDEVADRLIHKKMQNPDLAIRVIADGQFHPLAGTPLSFLDKSGKNLRRMRDAGIEVVLNPTLSTLKLEHRKLFVVDGKKALVSGSNLSTEYFATERWRELYDAAVEEGGEAVERFLEEQHGPAYKEYFERVKADPTLLEREPYPPTQNIAPHMREPWAHDYGVEIEGPAVQHLQASFLQSWLYQGEKLDPDQCDDDVRARYFPPATTTKGARTKVTHSVPRGQSEMRAAFQDFIASARRTLDFELAYVVVPEFVEMLQKAADRGVKIRLITNSMASTDWASTYVVFRQIADELLKHKNVTAHETSGYTHVKLGVADERYVLASTGNPERISWEQAFDETLVVDDRALARDVLSRVIEADAVPTRSLPVDVSTWPHRGFIGRVMDGAIGALQGIFVPLRNHAGERSLPPILPANEDVG